MRIMFKFFPPTFLSLYGDMSKRVMNILSSEVLKMEVYSIDEVFRFLCIPSIQRGILYEKKLKNGQVFQYL